LKKFLEESPIAEKVALPTAVVLRRLTLSPDEAGSIIESGSFSPVGGETCELEIGGQSIARGRIVRARGRSYFKIVEMGEGGSL
jgi:hypothetical protein